MNAHRNDAGGEFDVGLTKMVKEERTELEQVIMDLCRFAELDTMAGRRAAMFQSDLVAECFGARYYAELARLEDGEDVGLDEEEREEMDEVRREARRRDGRMRMEIKRNVYGGGPCFRVCMRGKQSEDQRGGCSVVDGGDGRNRVFLADGIGMREVHGDVGNC